jgi:antitoxin ParD1/3/4
MPSAPEGFLAALPAHSLLSAMMAAGQHGDVGLMNVSLGKKRDQFVESKVKSGDFQTASKVLREGLRLLEKEELLKRLSVGSMAELETKLLNAAASLEPGKGVDGEQVFARLRQRSKARRQNA